ncbi:hypothetical protein BOX15_Mlig009671g1 [Macrostomum lignano]|uniref:Uncharacterized protein n=1 Tax=Macrostomum lignano TaxID=282301 RepID=A0A267GDM4_9PLAT|nr:hypothetical protein BOX15_Mlig009671g1 [Macrostomum lignano]
MVDQQQKPSEATVEEVESRQNQCSPVVCILSVCLCLVLVALIVVTGLHTHTKLQASDDDDNSPFGCPLVPGRSAGLRGPCQALRNRTFPVTVGLGGGGGGGGGACADFFGFACPPGASSKQANVSFSQLLLLSVAQTACSRGQADVNSVVAAFFSVTDVNAELVKPLFKC